MKVESHYEQDSSEVTSSYSSYYFLFIVYYFCAPVSLFHAV